jgi:hypothetical protein
MEPAPGFDRCRTLTFLLLILFGAISTAQGQELPTAEGLPRPLELLPVRPVLPPPLPGAERIGPDSPIRLLPLAPLVETIGPLRIQAFATIEEEFTDNVNQTKNDRKSEFRTSFAPGLSARVERPWTTINFVYNPRYFLPGNRPDAAALDHYLTLRSTWQPSPRLRLGLAEDFTRSTDFRDVEDLGTRRTGTAGFLTNRSTLEAAYVPPNGRIGLSYSNVLQRNDAPEADNSLTHTMRTDGLVTNPSLNLGGSYTLARGEFDIASPYWEHSVDAQATRTLTPTVSASLSGLFIFHDPDRDPNFMIGRTRLGSTGAFGPYGSLRAEVGIAVFAQQNDTTKVLPGILLNWSQQFALLTVSATYQQDYQEHFQQVTSTGVTFTRSAGLALTSSGLLFRDLTAALTGQWVENSYQLTVPGLNGVSAGTVDRTWNLGVEIRYLMLRALSLVLGYTTTIRTSTDPTVEFLENRVRLGLTYQYDIF